jgi:DNA-binding protein H-NS
LTVDEILAPSPSKERKPVPVKYRYDGKEWSGRGRKPAWVQDLLAKGGKLEDYLVQSS